ncbi:MAG: sulfotransferase [Thiohalobacterales bacterium]|nr:sulfotransferase [Thiohalobacterales bacterium]
MKAGLPNNFILNGFDRSGTSAIARVLSTHPEIELIMQPFNSGSIREKLYRVLDDTNTSAEDYDFFSKLEQGVLERSYIRSHWHEKYSTVSEFVPDRLHLIKTTQNHLTITWIKRHFPRIELWGIWREPMDILASLVRNDFHISWYAGAATGLIETVRACEPLRAEFGMFIDDLANPVREMAFNIATRSWYYFSHLDPGKTLSYELFRRDPQAAFAPLLAYFGLSGCEFERQEETDLNIVGERYIPGSSHVDCIAQQDQAFCEKLFRPLYNVPAIRELSS